MDDHNPKKTDEGKIKPSKQELNWAQLLGETSPSQPTDKTDEGNIQRSMQELSWAQPLGEALNSQPTSYVAGTVLRESQPAEASNNNVTLNQFENVLLLAQELAASMESFINRRQQVDVHAAGASGVNIGATGSNDQTGGESRVKPRVLRSFIPTPMCIVKDHPEMYDEYCTFLTSDNFNDGMGIEGYVAPKRESTDETDSDE